MLPKPQKPTPAEPPLFSMCPLDLCRNRTSTARADFGYLDIFGGSSGSGLRKKPASCLAHAATTRPAPRDTVATTLAINRSVSGRRTFAASKPSANPKPSNPKASLYRFDCPEQDQRQHPKQADTAAFATDRTSSWAAPIAIISLNSHESACPVPPLSAKLSAGKTSQRRPADWFR